jgi:signal peptidase I
VIGLPGETIQVKDGRVTVINPQYPEGAELTEDYLAKDTYTRGTIEVTLSDTEYFVLGDNRDASLDSRVFGAVDVDLIVGRTWVRAWPFDRLTTFKLQNYNI